MFQIYCRTIDGVERTTVYAVDYDLKTKNTLFLIYDIDCWLWIDSRNCEPV